MDYLKGVVLSVGSLCMLHTVTSTAVALARSFRHDMLHTGIEDPACRIKDALHVIGQITRSTLGEEHVKELGAMFLSLTTLIRNEKEALEIAEQFYSGHEAALIDQLVERIQPLTK